MQFCYIKYFTVIQKLCIWILDHIFLNRLNGRGNLFEWKGRTWSVHTKRPFFLARQRSSVLHSSFVQYNHAHSFWHLTSFWSSVLHDSFFLPSLCTFSCRHDHISRSDIIFNYCTTVDTFFVLSGLISTLRTFQNISIE